MDDITFNKASLIKDGITVTRTNKKELDQAVRNNDRINAVQLDFSNDPITITNPDEELVDAIRGWCDRKVARLNDDFAAL